MTPLGKIEFEYVKAKTSCYQGDTLHIWIDHIWSGGSKELDTTSRSSVWKACSVISEKLLIDQNQQFRSAKELQRFIEIAYRIMQENRKIVRFQKNENDPTGSHSVFVSKTMKIGEIARMPMNPSRIYKYQPYDVPHWHRRKVLSHDVYYYWILDRDLCSFLGIPYYSRPNFLTHQALKDFVCMRLYSVTQPGYTQPRDLTKDNQLTWLIRTLTRAEQRRRTRYIIRQNKEEFA